MRTAYKNGEEIFTDSGCNSCDTCGVGGAIIHKYRCPDAWKDKLAECCECGYEFFPTVFEVNPDNHACSECREIMAIL